MGELSRSGRFVGVGIGEYDHYPRLPGAVGEVRQIAELLDARGLHTVVNSATTEAALQTELKAALQNQARDGEPLIVLWAGHGDKAPDASLRLVAQDTERGDAPALTPERIASLATRSGSTQILLVFDTCFSGGGTVPALANAERVFGERADGRPNLWLGVVASTMAWEKARDTLFGDHLVRLLRDGPADVKLRLRWSAHNTHVVGDDLIFALQEEWAGNAPQQLVALRYGYGRSMPLVPNPLHNPAAPPKVVEHLLHAARGGETDDERWYFVGRANVIKRLVGSIGQGRPGMQVVTGPAGCGKSALLGMVVCMSDPEQRAALRKRESLVYADPGEGSVHAHVYARGLARSQLVRELDHQLTDRGILAPERRGLRGPGELVDDVRACGTHPVVVIDGLDEAGLEAWPIAKEVLRPLSEYANVLVGTRDLPPPEAEGSSLVERLRPDESAVVIHLPAEVDDATDVHDYVLKRLKDVDAPGMNHEQVAEAVRDFPHPDDEGRFLLARMITTRLRDAPIDTTQPNWQTQLSVSVEQALDHALAALPALPARGRAGEDLPQAGAELLTALAWAQGAGLPDDIWPVVATALSPTGTTYARDDAYWALSVAGRYIVEAGEGGRAVYRPAHQQLAEHLRQTAVQDPERRIATALTSTYLSSLAAGEIPEKPSYLRQYAWRHCADAGPAGIDQLRRLVELDRRVFLPDLARAFGYLASRYGEAGQFEAAVPAAAEAVALYRELAAGDRIFRTDLAKALDELSYRYAKVERHGEAMEPAEEAVALYREAADESSAFLPYLAGMLSTASLRYSRVGRPAEAVKAAAEAVGLRRELAAVDPEILPALAGSLIDLGYGYSDLGRHNEALKPLEEAVELRRRLAAEDPEALPDLARTLNTLGYRYSDAKHHGRAVAAAEEAVQLYRRLPADNSEVSRNLAGALLSLGYLHTDAGRHDEAVEVVEEAVRLSRRLAADDPEALPDLGRALGSLGYRYSRAGRDSEALTTAEEAVLLWRQFAADHPGRLPDLAGALTDVGYSYADTGRHDEAVTAVEEAVELWRQLAAGNPRYLPNLARTLGTLANRHTDLGRHDDAVAAAEEVVRLRRQLATDDRALPDLADALSALGQKYSRVGRYDEAVAAAEETVQLQRQVTIDNDAGTSQKLAGRLRSLGYVYADVKRYGEAVAAAEEAVQLYFDGLEENRALLPDLAGALADLGYWYSSAGRRDEAMTALEEAVRLYRELAAENHPAASRILARDLGTLGNWYSDVGRDADATAADEESVLLYRQLASGEDKYQRQLARALSSIGIRYSRVGRHDEAVTALEEAVDLHRDLGVDQSEALTDLAHALSSLGRRYSRVDRHDEAVTAFEEAVQLQQRLASGDDRHRPDLARALGNAGIGYSEAGRHDEAVTALEAAVDLHRDLAIDQPEALPELARTLGNLGIAYARTGRHSESVVATEEAVQVFRQLAADDRGRLPDLADILNRLAVRRSNAGRHGEAVTAVEEAVQLHQQLAADKLIGLDKLVRAFDNLRDRHVELGDDWDADAAWTRTLAALPTTDLKAGLLIEKAKREKELARAVSDVIAALALRPAPTGRTLFRVHRACRGLRKRDLAGFDAEWRKQQDAQPGWLLLDSRVLKHIGAWLESPSYAAARNHHREHAEALADPGARIALDELELAGVDPARIRRYREILATAANDGIDEAYRHLVLAETLETWIRSDLAEQLRLFGEARDLYVSDEATALLEQRMTEHPDDTDLVFGEALVSLARDNVDDEVLAAIDEPDQIPSLLTKLLTADRPDRLRNATRLLLCVELDPSIEAELHVHLAIALVEGGTPEQAAHHVRTALQLDGTRAKRWIDLVGRRVGVHRELAELLPVLFEPRPSGT